MLKAFKTQLKLTASQKSEVNQILGNCRFVYNLYLAKNKEIYESEKKFMTGFDFSKWLNNEFLPNNLEYSWIKKAPSKSIKKSIMNAETAFKKFFKKESKFPRFKNKDSKVGCYFIQSIRVERHRIKLPKLGWLRLKEYGYIPTTEIKNCTVTRSAGKYYVSVLCEVEENTSKIVKEGEKNYGLGIDLGIKDLAITSDNKVFGNINKTKKLRKLSKNLKHSERSLSRKNIVRRKEKREVRESKNFLKNKLKIQRKHDKIKSIRTEYTKSVINSLVKENPQFIAIEDLNVSGMMKNRCLAKAIQQQNFYYFRTFLIQQCKKHNIEVRVIPRFYPSSKLCSCCGNKKKDLKLKDRIYICGDCDLEIDRDYNASINIRECTDYVVA